MQRDIELCDHSCVRVESVDLFFIVVCLDCGLIGSAWGTKKQAQMEWERMVWRMKRVSRILPIKK